MNMASSTVEHPITQWLRNTNAFWFSLYTSIAAFCLYTCVFAFRKAFTAATFEGIVYWGISYKVWLVTLQVIGYALSKFIGIRKATDIKLTVEQYKTVFANGL